MHVTVVGLGLIGGSLALDLRARGFAKCVSGVDVNLAHCEAALELNLVDEVVPLQSALNRSELLVLAMPVSAILQLLPEILDRVSQTATVTDVGSTKEAICRAVAGHPRRSQFVPSHPMAGTENSGPGAARSGLFDGKTAVICDPELSDPAHCDRVDQMYRALKMHRIHMSSSEHDLHAAYVSHLSHISSFVLANTVLAQEKNASTIFNLAGGGFESTVRLAKSAPDMWGPIFEQNNANVVAAVGSYIEHLQRFHQALVANDREETRRLIEDANRIRQTLATLGSGVPP